MVAILIFACNCIVLLISVYILTTQSKVFFYAAYHILLNKVKDFVVDNKLIIT